jgi:hypothetical protein
MTTTPITTENETAKRLDREHVFHSWSAQATLDPVVIAGGLGIDTSTSRASWSTSTSGISIRPS